jgi:hypothetical protein
MFTFLDLGIFVAVGNVLILGAPKLPSWSGSFTETAVTVVLTLQRVLNPFNQVW